MIVTVTRVEDFDRFLETFSTTGLDKRREHGCRGSHVIRDPDEPSRVWVIFEWSNEDYQEFLSDPEVPAIARELALREPPSTLHPISYDY